MIKPVLIFTWGNPSRGDDALGTEVYNRLQTDDLENVDLLTDFQLQIEHAVDLEKRERVLFIDASISAAAPYEFYRLNPVLDDSYTTHAMSPESLLATYIKVNQAEPPPAFMLSIRGYDFSLGLPISDEANDNLTEAVDFVRQLMVMDSSRKWESLARS
jgi:hydrogenase maturation protease